MTSPPEQRRAGHHKRHQRHNQSHQRSALGVRGINGSLPSLAFHKDQSSFNVRGLQ